MQGVYKQHPDVDSAYAFLVALAAGLCHFMTLGFAMAFSGYYVIFLQVFQESKGLTAWVSSINYGMLCAIGPIAGIMIQRYGCRVTVFIGGVLAAVGLITSAFAQSVLHLVLTFGLISGTGYGLAFTGCIVVISEYFQRYRVFTMGLSLAGGGLGNIVFPWILGPLLHNYDWRWSLILTGAISLHICAAALLMTPIKLGLATYDTEQRDIEKRVMKKILTRNDLKDPNSNLKEPVIAKNNVTASLLPDLPQSPTVEPVRYAGLRHMTYVCGMTLFTRVSFWQVCLNTFLYCFSMSVLYTHISSYGVELGLSTYQQNMVLSCLGFSGLLGRLVLGGLALVSWVNTPLLFSVCYVIAGAAILFIAVQTTVTGLMVLGMVYGLGAAAYGPLLSETTFMICGQEQFSAGYGWVMAFMAIGQVTGAPAAGFIYDCTAFYPGSFYLAGCTLVVAGLIILPYAITNCACYKRHAAETEGTTQHNTDSTVRDNSNTDSTVRDNCNTQSTLRDNSKTESTLIDNSNTQSTLRDNSKTESPLRDNSKTESMLRDNSKTESTLRDNSKTESTLRDNSKTESTLRDRTVTTNSDRNTDVGTDVS